MLPDVDARLEAAGMAWLRLLLGVFPLILTGCRV